MLTGGATKPWNHLDTGSSAKRKAMRSAVNDSGAGPRSSEPTEAAILQSISSSGSYRAPGGSGTSACRLLENEVPAVLPSGANKDVADAGGVGELIRILPSLLQLSMDGRGSARSVSRRFSRAVSCGNRNLFSCATAAIATFSATATERRAPSSTRAISIPHALVATPPKARL